MPVLALILVALCGLNAAAQASPTRPAEISATGYHGVEIPATTVSLEIDVTSSAATPARAGQLNAAASARLRAALRQLGIPDDSTVTRGISSRMSVDYETKDTSFVTTNSLFLQTRRLALLPRIIETILVEGATEVSDLTFTSDSTEAAFLEAVRSATAVARQRAAVMADAAGGRLGALVALSASESTQRPMNFAQANLSIVTASRRSPGVEIEAPVVRVGANVVMRYEFIPKP